MPYHECDHPDHIRYGPRPRSVEEEQSRSKMQRMLVASSKSRMYKLLVDAFNESQDAQARVKLLSDIVFSPPNPRQTSPLHRTCSTDISWVHTPYQIIFPDIGVVHRNKKVGQGILLKKGADSPMYFCFHDKNMVIKKLGEDKKYTKLAEFPALSLTLIMDEQQEEDDHIIFTFSMQHNPSYNTNASFESAAL